MSVTCKSTVRLVGVTPALVRLLYTLVLLDESPVDGQPEDLVITSINDSTHKARSKHYTNEALDVRSKTFAGEKAKAAFLSHLRTSLGDGFTVLYEGAGTPNEHFHAQVKRT